MEHYNNRNLIVIEMSVKISEFMSGFLFQNWNSIVCAKIDINILNYAYPIGVIHLVRT